MVFDIPTCIMTIVAGVLTFLIVFLATRKLSSGTPKGMQNFFEWVIDFVRGIARQSMDDKTAERFVTLGVGLFLYLFIANQLGLVLNVITVHTHAVPSIGITEGAKVAWWKSPTATVSIPFAMAILVLLYTHWLGLRRGVGKYLKSYVEPHWALLPLNLIEELSKFLSFPLRLYGNIFAGEVLVGILLPTILSGIAYYVLALPLFIWIGYSLFVGSIQAFIFTMLSMVYISHRLHSQESH
jgi:F-type H+-transporting ATPase subunit a